MSPSPDYNAMESEYQVQYRAVDKPEAPRRRTGLRKTRTAARPKSFNGMHRRRGKRISW